MSSISSLPNELIVAIVAEGQQDPFDAVSDNLQPMASKPEWTVSHLSRHFRDVVVGAPSLWTVVEASLDTDETLEILKLYLERSRACPISLALHVGFRKIMGSNGIHRCVLGAKRLREIDPHFNRAGRLRIVLWSMIEQWNPLLLPPFRHITAPNLQHLEVIMKTDPHVQKRAEVFSSGPPTKLSSLKMSGWTLPLPVPQWTASLTHLELWSGDWQWRSAHHGALLAALTKQCPLLVHLHLAEDYVSSATRLHIPSLQSLHISVSDEPRESYLLDIVDLFDTPALTEFIIDGTHGDQVFVLFKETSVPHTSFPALTSFSLVNSRSCRCGPKLPSPNRISSPPLALFPALSSLTLINQCSASKLVEDLFGSASQPWPQLQAVTLCPTNSNLHGVRSALRDAAGVKHQRGQTLPKLRLSSKLLSLEDWREKGMDVEKFDPDVVLNLFRS
ncbi:hypothetical protein DFH06DRAFT_1484220 [Mycena polygramma]|nr:hypothetical protein DFH06DRAFT_1484220 [Mycena polygramma]